MADGSDNFATRYLVADACFLARKPLVTGAVGIFDGTLTTIRAHERAADGTPNPTYRCLFPEPPPPGTVPACAEAGILGALTGVIGSLMALEVLREIVGFGEGLVSRLLMMDARSMRFETLRLCLGSRQPALGRTANDQGPLGARVTALFLGDEAGRLHDRPPADDVGFDGLGELCRGLKRRFVADLGQVLDHLRRLHGLADSGTQRLDGISR